MNLFEYNLKNIPHLVKEEADVDRYLRAFAQLVASFGDDVDIDLVIASARDAISFIAHDAFRQGFEACHDNLLAPLRENAITRETAIAEMRRHAEVARQAIVAKFEDFPGAPNQLTVEIEDVAIPDPKLRRGV